MQRKIFWLFLMLPLCCISGLAEPWRQVAPDKSGFTVQMPGKPVEEKEFEQREDEKLLTYTLSLENEIIKFVAGYNEISKPEAVAPTKAVLDTFREGMQQVAPKLLGERDIKLKDFSGRALSLKNEDGLIFRVRYFVANRRIYYVLASVFEEDNQKATPTIEKFLNSLQFYSLPAPPAPIWKKFSSEKGNFSALFPGMPKQKVNDRDLSHPPVFSFVGYDENAAYLVTYTDYLGASPMPETEEGLSQFQAGMLKGIKNSTLLSVKNITVNQWLGRELQIRDGNDIIHQMRIIAVNRRMFTIDAIAASERKAGAASAIEKFFESFEAKADESEPQSKKAKAPRDT